MMETQVIETVTLLSTMTSIFIRKHTGGKLLALFDEEKITKLSSELFSALGKLRELAEDDFISDPHKGERMEESLRGRGIYRR